MSNLDYTDFIELRENENAEQLSQKRAATYS